MIIALVAIVAVVIMAIMLSKKKPEENNKIELESNYKILESRYSELESNFKKLESKYSEIESNSNLVERENSSLKTDLRNKEERLNEEIEKNNVISKQFEEQRKQFTDLANSNSALVSDFKNKEELLNKEREKNNKLTYQLEEETKKTSELSNYNSTLKANYDAIQEKQRDIKREFEEMQKSAKLEFEKAANEILQEKTSIFTQSNQKNIEELIKPFKESVKDFKENLDTKLKDQLVQRSTLEANIKNLMEQTNEVSKQANNLASALKSDNKKAGNWGESVLERILEYSGLIKDIHFKIQASYKDDENNEKRPDVLVFLPDNRAVIIDSKVSLVAYDNYFSSETEEEKVLALKQHIVSLRSHIDNLASKKYDDIELALDFTMLFMPIEGAYMLAVQTDSEIWEYAYKKRIILISSTTLISSLKIIQDLWRKDIQNKNALNIVKQGELMLNKLTLFLESFEAVGKSINSAKIGYEKALGQLKEGRGNVISQGEKLKLMGLKIDKQLPKIFEDYEIDIADEVEKIEE